MEQYPIGIGGKTYSRVEYGSQTTTNNNNKKALLIEPIMRHEIPTLYSHPHCGS